MKQSKKFHKLANEEDNDLKAFSLLNKAVREERLERFKDNYLEQLKAKLKTTIIYNH